MKKRIASLLLALLMAFTLLPVQALAEELANSGAGVEEELPLEETLTQQDETLWEAAVPAEQPVDEPAESDTTATNADIVASGTCGGEGDGSNLTWTLDSDSLLTIEGSGEMANWGLNSSAPWCANRGKVKRAVIDSGVTSIGNYAFDRCSLLASITIPDSVTSIGYSAFDGCSGLTSVTIPNSVTLIGNCAFNDCSSLASVSIPNSVTRIGKSAFYSCGSLTSITIPDSVTSIENSAFYNCSSLTSITLPNSVTSIGKGVFEACSSLTSITIPNSVTSIEGNAFSSCRSLTSITIPSSVTSIGSYAFSYCSTLTSVSIPDSVTSIGDYAFSGCHSLTGITIPDSVTSIGDYAFSVCRSLTSVTVPNSVTSIGNYVFRDCRSLTSISIPNSVTSIGAGAFTDCSSLASITIPDSVTSIGGSAFYGCSSLTGITIPDGVTSIGNCAFYGCSSLTSVTIPNSVTSIEHSAFRFCSSLTDVYYSGSEAQWQAISIDSSNEPLTSATIHYNSTGPKLVSLSFDAVAYAAVPGRSTQIRLQLRAVDNNCEELVRLLTFASSNNDVFMIDSSNISYELYGDTTADVVITATPKVTAGSAIITAMLPDGTSASCEVAVIGQNTTVTLRKDIYAITVDDTGTLYMTASNGEMLPELQWKWTSSDEDVVSIQAGDGSYQNVEGGTPAALILTQCTFVAKKEGNATITCTLSNGAAASCRILVYNADDAKKENTIKNNSYNTPTYNETDLECAVKQINKLKNNWEKQYKKYTAAVDSTLKPLDKEDDILKALQTNENAAKQMRQADEAASKTTNMMLTFSPGFPEEWKDTAYEALCEIFEGRVDSTVDFSSIDLSKDVSANSTLVNMVCSGFWNESGSKSYEYAKNKAVMVRYSCIGYLAAGSGHMTFSRGRQSYEVVICSSMETVKNCMAIYLNACKTLGQKAVQNARKATINDMLTLIGANDLTESAFKSLIAKGLKAYDNHLREIGLESLSDNLTELYLYYDSIKRITGAINSMDPEHLTSSYKTLQSELDKLMNPDFGTTEAERVNKALAELKKASQQLYRALNELITNGYLSKDSSLDWVLNWFSGKKTQVKCPIDMEIYRGDDLIGYVNETEIWYDDSIYVEENDEAKIIYSSAGDELSIRLTGTDYGDLSITVEEYANGVPVERLNYYNIDLYEGKSVSLAVPAQTVSEVKDTLTVLDEGTHVAASEYISAAADASVYINADISDDNAGTISGDGVYVRGDAVVLRAFAATGYLFSGWYDENGHLISTSAFYEFSASNDCTLLAKFVPVPLPGDVNGDGIVDVYDLQALYEYCCGIKTLPIDILQRADANQDASVDITDVQMLYTYLT